MSITQNPMDVKRPDRIDFTALGDGRVIVVKLWHDSENRQDIPVSRDTKPDGFSLDEALEWCRNNGYVVRTWPGGARAWKGELRVIRTAHEIMRLRRKLEAEWQAAFGRNPGRWSDLDTLLSLDLAYDG